MIFQRSPEGGFRQVYRTAKSTPKPKGAVERPSMAVRLLDRVISPVMRTVYERTQFAGVWLTLTATENSYVLHGIAGVRGKTHNVYFGKLADGTFLAGVD